MSLNTNTTRTGDHAKRWARRERRRKRRRRMPPDFATALSTRTRWYWRIKTRDITRYHRYSGKPRHKQADYEDEREGER